MKHPNRESWFKAAVEKIEQQVFKPAGYSLPKHRIGVGWPTGNRERSWGQCFGKDSSDDKTYEIFVSPRTHEPSEILAILVHELCHTVAGTKAGHRKPFVEVMRAVGMVKPFTASRPNDDLMVMLAVIAGKLGFYPHAALKLKKKPGGQKPGSRLLKVQCPECEYVARVTRKWLDEAGAPLCPVHKVAFKETEVKDK